MVVAGLSVDRSRLAWYAVGALLFGILALISYTFVGTLVFSLFVYYSTRPIYKRIRGRIPQASVAAAVSLLALVLPVLILFAYTLAIATQEFTAAAASANVTQFDGLLGQYGNVSSIVDRPEQLLDAPGAREAAEQILNRGLGAVGLLGTALLHLFVVFAVAFYLLRDGSRLSRWTRQRFSDDRGIFDDFTRGVDRDFKNVFFGNILNAILTGAIGALSYTILDVFVFAGSGISIPYAALIGILAGAASLVPVIGMKIVYVPVAAWLFFRSFQEGGGGLYLLPVVFTSVSFLIVDVIPDLVLRPYVSGRNLHTGTVMFAYILGPLMFGWYGLFLGPMILVLAFHFAKTVLPELVSRQEFAPYSVDPSNVAGSPSDVSASDPELVAEGVADAEDAGPAGPDEDPGRSDGAAADDGGSER